MKSYLFFQHGDVFHDSWDHTGEDQAKFHEDTLATLPSSALQVSPPLPTILKKNNKKNPSKSVHIGATRYQDYFSRRESQDSWKYMMETSHHYRRSSAMCAQEMDRVQARAEEWKKHILLLRGRDLLPTQLEQLFKYCLSGGSFVSTATPEDLNVFTSACTEYKNDMKHAATTIQCAFRVPPTASFAKLALWKRLYKAKTKTAEKKINSEENTKPKVETATVEVKPTNVKPASLTHRVYKSSINSKKNRATRQATLDGIRKSKKATNLARRRGSVAVTAQSVQQAPVQALIPSAPSVPIKKKKRDSSYQLVQPSNLEMISILSECALTSITEVDEPIEFSSILKSSKCKILPIMEVEKPIEYEFKSILSKFKLIPIFEGEDPEEEVDTSDDTSETDEPRQLEQEVEADDDIDFGQVEDPLLDLDAIPEAAPEPHSPKKPQCRRCKAVESSLDGRYWSVSSRRRRKSSRVRRKPDFFTPS